MRYLFTYLMIFQIHILILYENGAEIGHFCPDFKKKDARESSCFLNVLDVFLLFFNKCLWSSMVEFGIYLEHLEYWNPFGQLFQQIPNRSTLSINDLTPFLPPIWNFGTCFKNFLGARVRVRVVSAYSCPIFQMHTTIHASIPLLLRF